MAVLKDRSGGAPARPCGLKGNAICRRWINYSETKPAMLKASMAMVGWSTLLFVRL